MLIIVVVSRGYLKLFGANKRQVRAEIRLVFVLLDTLPNVGSRMDQLRLKVTRLKLPTERYLDIFGPWDVSILAKGGGVCLVLDGCRYQVWLRSYVMHWLMKLLNCSIVNEKEQTSCNWMHPIKRMSSYWDKNCPYLTSLGDGLFTCIRGQPVLDNSHSNNWESFGVFKVLVNVRRLRFLHQNRSSRHFCTSSTSFPLFTLLFYLVPNPLQ